MFVLSVRIDDDSLKEKLTKFKKKTGIKKEKIVEFALNHYFKQELENGIN